MRECRAGAGMWKRRFTGQQGITQMQTEPTLALVQTGSRISLPAAYIPSYPGPFVFTLPAASASTEPTQRRVLILGCNAPGRRQSIQQKNQHRSHGAMPFAVDDRSPHFECGRQAAVPRSAPLSRQVGHNRMSYRGDQRRCPASARITIIGPAAARASLPPARSDVRRAAPLRRPMPAP
jgi:hypothetical protein